MSGARGAPTVARPPLRSDGATALCAFAVLLFALPSAFVVAPLGSAGAPATLVGLVGFVWWVWYHLNRWWIRDVGPQPVRWAIVILLATILVSYAHAMFLPIPGDEISPADSAILRLLGLCGIALVANDGIRTPERMRRLIGCLILMVSLASVLSIVQFATGESWIDRLSLPGLARSAELGLDERQNFARPSGTATHPVEYAAVLSMMLPVAIMYAKSRARVRLIHLLPVALLAIGVALSLSRTAILCVALGVVLILPALPRLWRICGLAGGVLMLAVFYVSVPGFIGTLRGLFVGFSEDPSVRSRTGSYEVVLEFFSRSPLVGRGLGTFLPEYWILDNMYLQFLIEIGVLGLLATLGLFVTAMTVCLRARRDLPAQRDRDLATGLAAGVAAGATSFAFFDGLAFPQAAFCLFLMVGMCGAYWRLAEPARRERRAASAAPVASAPEGASVASVASTSDASDASDAPDGARSARTRRTRS